MNDHSMFQLPPRGGPAPYGAALQPEGRGRRAHLRHLHPQQAGHRRMGQSRAQAVELLRRGQHAAKVKMELCKVREANTF